MLLPSIECLFFSQFFLAQKIIAPPQILMGSLLERSVVVNNTQQLKTGIQRSQHGALSGLLCPYSILFSYCRRDQEADLLCRGEHIGLF